MLRSVFARAVGPRPELLALTILVLASGCRPSAPSTTRTPVGTHLLYAAQLEFILPDRDSDDLLAEVAEGFVERLRPCKFRSDVEAEDPHFVRVWLDTVDPDEIALAKERIAQPGRLAIYVKNRVVSPDRFGELQEDWDAYLASQAGAQPMPRPSVRALSGARYGALDAIVDLEDAIDPAAIDRLFATTDQLGRPSIFVALAEPTVFELTDVLSDHLGESFVFAIDDHVAAISTMHPGMRGRFQITGTWTQPEIEALAGAVHTPWLGVPPRLVSEEVGR